MKRGVLISCVLLFFVACKKPGDTNAATESPNQTTSPTPIDSSAGSGPSGGTTTAAVPCETPASPPPIPNLTVSVMTTGFSNPVHVTNARDGSGRLFVVEQGGLVRVVQNNSIQTSPFLDIRDRVDADYHNEAGLLSIAFHPNYKTNGKFYVDYTSSPSKTLNRCGSASFCTVISEFTQSATGKLQDSERVLFTIDQPFGNHNGGQIMFGPDTSTSYLYIATGDGGSGDDPGNRAQNLGNLLGKMLRIDVDNKDAGLQYAIPTDNPSWTGVSGARREIYAYGLRNPWRFSFDPSTQLLYAGDVGQSAREEVDIIRKGKNYGWRVMEGLICNSAYATAGACATPENYEAPIADYVRTSWGGVTGGVVYRGSSIPELCGVYLYTDYGTGRFYALRYDGTSVTATKDFANPADIPNAIVSFGYDENYEAYAVDISSGSLYKFMKAP